MQQAIRVREYHLPLHKAGEDHPLININLLVASPLRRGLNTAEHIFGDDFSFPGTPRLALPLAAERLYFSSDIGRYRHTLEESHPSWDFSLIEHGKTWWFDIDGNNGPEGENQSVVPPHLDWRPHPELAQFACAGEPEHKFRERMMALKEWLQNRPEKNIVVVTHWGVIRALTGQSVDNCAVVEVLSDDLLDDMVIDDT